MLPGDSLEARKARGAFFTPYAIAEFLARWATAGLRDGSYLDPTCGDGVFLLAAASVLAERGEPLGRHSLFGIDLHSASVAETRKRLEQVAVPNFSVFEGDFSEEPAVANPGARLPLMDAVLGNPPFIRFQEQSASARTRAVANALGHGVNLSGLASSWASILVHSASYLKPEGRMAMVLPAELLSVSYAEPIRRWLRSRFGTVHLVLFNQLQFGKTNEQVVLLVAKGSGGCDAFSLHEVEDSVGLKDLHIFDSDAYVPKDYGKWTEMFVPEAARRLLSSTATDLLSPLSAFGKTELGTVTGANKYFMMNEQAKVERGLREGVEVSRTVPAGTRHLRGMNFTEDDWQGLRDLGERVWMLNPHIDRGLSAELEEYLSHGESIGVDAGYKCSAREPWWKVPVQSPPTHFFTYMSHVGPRLIHNDAKTTFVNSMHGLRVKRDIGEDVSRTLPYAALNSVTLLNAELMGRAYGGGLLKMEPREAAALPVPSIDVMTALAPLLSARRVEFENRARKREWGKLTTEIDILVLQDALGMNAGDIAVLRGALSKIRRRRSVNVDG